MFLDEAGAKTNMTRRYARGPRGQRVVEHAPAGHWCTTTMLAALRQDRIEAPLVLAGAFITPVLLPYVPFRSFAIKGWITGLCAVIPAVHFWAPNGGGGPLLAAAAFLLVPALSSYLALQFTGATTYTGMSGVKKELKAAVPVYIATAGISLIFLVGYKLLEWEVL